MKSGAGIYRREASPEGGLLSWQLSGEGLEIVGQGDCIIVQWDATVTVSGIANR